MEKIKSKYCVQCGEKLFLHYKKDQFFFYCKEKYCPNYGILQIGKEKEKKKKKDP